MHLPMILYQRSCDVYIFRLWKLLLVLLTTSNQATKGQSYCLLMVRFVVKLKSALVKIAYRCGTSYWGAGVFGI